MCVLSQFFKIIWTIRRIMISNEIIENVLWWSVKINKCKDFKSSTQSLSVLLLSDKI